MTDPIAGSRATKRACVERRPAVYVARNGRGLVVVHVVECDRGGPGMPACCEYGPIFSCAYRSNCSLVSQTSVTRRPRSVRAPVEQATRPGLAPRLVVHQPRDLVVLLERSTVELSIYRNRHLLHPLLG